MNEAKAIETLGNIFHFETYTGENGNYELSSNYWNLKFNIRIRQFGITIVNDFSTRCSLDTDEDETTIARELLHFIGDVICDASKTYTYEGDSGILAWPYSCNFAYIKTLKQNMDMNPGELEYEYAGRKAGLTNSRKPIKSFRDTSTEDTSNDYGFYWEGENIYDKNGIHWYFGDYINGNTGIEPYSSYIQAVKETEDNIRDSFTEDEIPDPEDYAYQLIDFAVETLPDPGKFIKEYEGFVGSSRKPVDSSMQGQERGIQAIMDEYGCSREEAIEIMNNEVTSGCHGKAKKKNKKEIKSSTETWEAGYEAFKNGEGYADYPTGLSNREAEDWMSGWDYANREDKGELTEAEQQVWSEDDEERLRGEFADERGLNLNEDEFPEDEYQEWVHRGAAMYSSTTRNAINLNKIFG